MQSITDRHSLFPKAWARSRKLRALFEAYFKTQFLQWSLIGSWLRLFVISYVSIRFNIHYVNKNPCGSRLFFQQLPKEWVQRSVVRFRAWKSSIFKAIQWFGGVSPRHLLVEYIQPFFNTSVHLPGMIWQRIQRCDKLYILRSGFFDILVKMTYIAMHYIKLAWSFTCRLGV